MSAGDGTAPWAEGDPKRYDDYTVSGAGTITNTYVQGGERYEEITLTTPGTITLSGIGVNYIADRTQASALPGYFDSSNNELNQIWYDSEYTDQLDSVPAESLPGVWSVTGGVLQAGGSSAGDGVGLLAGGSSWGNYTVSFQTQIIDNQAGWFVRGQDYGDGYAFILNDSTDTSGTPNTLQELHVSDGTYTSLGSVSLSTPLLADSWHTVSTCIRLDPHGFPGRHAAHPADQLLLRRRDRGLPRVQRRGGGLPGSDRHQLDRHHPVQQRA